VKIALEALVLALIVVAALTPAARALAFRLGAVARPGGRHVHQKSIPRLGGVAICAGFCATIAVLYFSDPGAQDAFRFVRSRMLAVFAGGVAMCVVGIVDDTRGIRAVHKLLLQIVVATATFACGFRIVGVHVPLIGDIDTASMSLPLTVLWIVGIINAINLIDGLDGLAAGVVFFASLTNLVVAWLTGDVLVQLISAAIAGSVLGFLFYNFNPARIFMGDSGSYFLGYVLATTALTSVAQKASTAVSLLVPILALGVPIFDTLFAMVRRILERRSVFSPDRGHIHHRLLDMGLTHRRAVILIYGVCAFFTFAAIGVALERIWQVGAALLGATVAMIGLVRFVGYFEYLHQRLRQKSRLRSRDVELLRFALPDLPRRLDGARTEAEIFQELWSFAAAANLGFVEVIATPVDDAGPETPPNPSHAAGTAAPKERCVHRWPAGFQSDAPEMREMLAARYPLGVGATRGALRFGWRSEQGDVSPQCDILLQVAADAVAERLARLGSDLAPASVPEQEQVHVPLRAL
jgi:UDP-GlcNAc:undecaprenyl-phosphate GlcNAc-1-phosphate transferase